MNTPALSRRIFSLFLPFVFVLAGTVHAASALTPTASTDIPKTDPFGSKGDGQIAAISIVPADHAWYTGGNVNIKWDWPGYVDYPVEVTLWQGSSLMATIDPRQTKLYTGWVVPNNIKPGAYIVKVKSVRNPANHSEKQVNIVSSTLAIVPPTTAGQHYVKYPFKWRYVGNVGPTVDITITTTAAPEPHAGGKTDPISEVLHIRNFSTGNDGQGEYDEWIPNNHFEQYFLITVQSTKSPEIKSIYKVRVSGDSQSTRLPATN